MNQAGTSAELQLHEGAMQARLVVSSRPCLQVCVLKSSSINPLLPPAAEALYLVEGAGQVGLGLSWGDGFAHARSLLDTKRFISDPSAFYRSLVGCGLLSG